MLNLRLHVLPISGQFVILNLISMLDLFKKFLFKFSKFSQLISITISANQLNCNDRVHFEKPTTLNYDRLILFCVEGRQITIQLFFRIAAKLTNNCSKLPYWRFRGHLHFTAGSRQLIKIFQIICFI